METQLLISNIYAIARHLNNDIGSHQLSITPKRDRWHVLLKLSSDKTEHVASEGGSLNEALLKVLEEMVNKAFPTITE